MINVTTTDRPAHHPANFQVTYRRSRHYVDHLPACDIAPASADKLPSVTTLIRRAWPQTYKKSWAFADGTSEVYPLDLVRALEWLRSDDRPHYGTNTGDEFARAFLESAGADLDRAAKRGSGVHDVAEAIIARRTPTIAPDVAPYVDAVEAAIGQLGIGPDALCEHVVFNREYGYAGTFDVLDGGHLVDWKSRTVGSRLEPREGEVAQLGAYALAEYLIAADTDRAVRRHVPDITRISLCLVAPDEFLIVDIDEDTAIKAWLYLLRCDEARRTGQAAARKAIKATTTHPARTVSDRDAILSRFQRLDTDAKAMVRQRWPWRVPAAKLDDTELNELVALMDDVARDLGQPFTPTELPATVAPERPAPTPPTAWQPPPDGGPCDAATIEAMKQQARRLPDDIKAWCSVRRGESIAHGRGQWTEAMTVRWLEVNRAVINAAMLWADQSDHDEELLRTWLAASTGDYACLQPGIALGAIFGSLTIEQACTLANDLAAIYGGTTSLGFADDGRPVLRAA